MFLYTIAVVGISVYKIYINHDKILFFLMEKEDQRIDIERMKTVRAKATPEQWERVTENRLKQSETESMRAWKKTWGK